MKLPVKKPKELSSKPEVKVEEDNTSLIENLGVEIRDLEHQIGALQVEKRAKVKKKFLLEHSPYKPGDKVVFNISNHKDKIEEAIGVLEYDDSTYGRPYFYARLYKKGTDELAKNRRTVYNKSDILRLAE